MHHFGFHPVYTCVARTAIHDVMNGKINVLVNKPKQNILKASQLCIFPFLVQVAVGEHDKMSISYNDRDVHA